MQPLNVWWDGVLVGSLGPDRFTYEDDWVADPASPPISHSLPKDRRRFQALFWRPFFEGLLPVGAQRKIVAEVLGIWPDRAHRLLAHMGAELAGAVTLLREDEVPPDPTLNGAPVPLSDDELVDFLATIRERPFLVGTEEGPRLSLAGAEPKIPVVLVNGRVALPVFGQPTTHILKPGSLASTESTENEAFAMRLGAHLGLGVADVRAEFVGGRSYLLIERYDRAKGDDGSVHRLHQEGFLQAFGMVPLPKVARKGGPGYAQCFDFVRQTCTFPALAVLKLLDAAILQVILGNASAHARNYSLLWRRRGEVALAPLHGLATTVVLPHIPAEFTMKVAGQSTLEDLGHGDWVRFAGECKLGPSYVRRRVRELCGRTVECSEAVAAELGASGLSEGALVGLAILVRGRAELLERTAR